MFDKKRVCVLKKKSRPGRGRAGRFFHARYHPRGNPGANFKSISHRRYLREVASEWELTRETMFLPLGCLQGGFRPTKPRRKDIVTRDAVLSEQNWARHKTRIEQKGI